MNRDRRKKVAIVLPVAALFVVTTGFRVVFLMHFGAPNAAAFVLQTLIALVAGVAAGGLLFLILRQ